MPPKPKENLQRLQDECLFVGGPLLKGKPNVRSAFFRRVIGRNRARSRQVAADNLELMLRKQDGANGPIVSCVCSYLTKSGAPVSTAVGSPGSNKYRMIYPKARKEQDGGILKRCPACGGNLYAPAALAPRPQLHGAGRYDPLLPINSTMEKLNVHELLDFAATIIWPHFRLAGHAANCYQSWVFPLEDNLQLYAILWAAAYHRDVLRVTSGVPCPKSGQQLYLKSLALQALQTEVANVSKLTSPDRLVMCTLWLAANDKHKRIVRDLSPFNPPFINLHALDFCGGQDYHPLHWHMVQDIIQRFGGIGSIRTYALAWLVSLSSLMTAMQFLCKPIYPVMTVYNQPLDLQPPTDLFRPHGYDDKGFCAAGSGFYDFHYLWPPVKQNVVQVFIHLGQYSAVLQYFQGCSTCSPVALDLLGDSRNQIHHRLLSLPSEHDTVDLILEYKELAPTYKARTFDQTRLSWEIYLACRLSAILYAAHVTFPIPRTKMVRGILLSSLCPRLESLCAHKISSPLLIWCLAVVISTMHDESPSTLVNYAAQLCHEFGVNNTGGLSDFLRSFAWVDAAVNDGWEDMWTGILIS
ncbi:hypothetical protein BJX63DRAFT_398174 [Aspergillus granulosus]|uniref:Uncharacterized protein n=1 Tax=Aspergillus granulosus TaxID=176169 RepID=A0ABR4H8F8_9EURO